MSSTLTRRLAAARDRLGPERRTVRVDQRVARIRVRPLFGTSPRCCPTTRTCSGHPSPLSGCSRPPIRRGCCPGLWSAGGSQPGRASAAPPWWACFCSPAAIVAFGFGSSLAALDGLRFVQGIACGCIWGGGLAWVIAIAPRGRRGEILGSVLASAIFGTLLGPILGTLAVAVGTRVVFTFVGGVALALTAWTLNHPEPPPARLGAGAPLRALARSPRLVLGFWLILLEAATIGALGTLLPLRLSRFGASGVAIGVTFVLASLVSTIVSPAVGRVVDRRGILRPAGRRPGADRGAAGAASAAPIGAPAGRAHRGDATADR